ncbi:hypothetical protein N7474_004346 [Penicillium riverlandense]|uniref:uncharacterized protein n=1 Tax=Penicillium riverlandense TaxID=1903569 RepID=UPI002548CCB7|nr:uncharacterized protein N7474_004346 [Penicillium riverlandense]KAJ5818755.1 hypothetical protein N7474_004346 [Penicillium riverlandense]
MSSPWPWHFVSVSEDEKLRRRDLLDLRGTYAQWSILAVIIIIRIYRSLTTASATTPKPRRGPTSWWDLPLVSGTIESRRQYLICSIWLAWLLSLSVWNSGDERTKTDKDMPDYLHLTKALAHVALSQVPLQVLMSPAAYISTTKPSAASMVSVLTSLPQSMLTPYHRLFGRTVISPLLLGHAVLYLAFFVQSSHPEFGSLLLKRVRDLDVQCGLLAISVMVSILLYVRPRAVVSKGALLSSSPLGSMQDRRRSFYVVHLSLVLGLCLAAYFHVAHAQFYMLQALGAFVVNGVCSWVMVQRS